MAARPPAVCIAGVGLIGGSLGLALRRSGRVREVVGVSRPETIAAARAVGAIDRGCAYDDLEQAASACDVIVLATPIRRIIELITRLSRAALPPGTIVTDVGSTKALILEGAEALLPPEAVFIGGHPMAGAEKAGIGAADPFLFQNAYYVLCPSRRAPEAATRSLGGLLESIGARVLVMDAQVHDRTVAAVSHLPHLLAVALVNFVAGMDSGHALELAAGGFRDMTRIASSPFGVWKDIIETNLPAIARTLRAFGETLGACADDLEAGALGEAFEHAARTRALIPRDTKGFLRPLAELLVVVEDRPGMIARIARPLADAGINIQDIEVLKVREGEGGTLRLAFKDRAASERARAMLAAEGFDARHRDG
ncbi:MAG TPA: prephenate dehydrogenase/arogenate dehydrogenase family protein [Planctomycetes bacterium]|nr:prephenate dehydrogenase/arogenate dehydrogenase family protein [Planctomycetota bacterium]